MPVRRVPMSYTSVTGRKSLASGTRAVATESKLEYDFVTLMSFDPDVTEIEEQPVAIIYDDNGKRRSYTPDFLIKRRAACPILAEVKPSRFVKGDVKRKLNAGKRYAATRGWSFQLWTEREIRGPMLKNAQFLLGYKETTRPPDAVEQILRTIRHGDARPICDVVAELWPEDDARAAGLPTLWHLIACRTVFCDLDREIDMSSAIWLEEGARDD